MKKNAALPMAPILALNIALMAACPLPAAPNDPMPLPGATADTAQAPQPTAISNLLTTSPAMIGGMKLDLPTLTKIYELNGQARLWTTETGLNKNGKVLLKEIPRQAEGEGLRASYYLTTDISDRLRAQDPAILAELDVLLTQALVSMLTDVSIGRINPKDPAQNVQDIEMKKNPAPTPETLFAVMKSKDTLDVAADYVRPQNVAYLNLVSNLRLLRGARDKGGGWPAFTRDFPRLSPGDAHPNVIAVRTRLIDLGFLPLDLRFNQTQWYDDTLARAVVLFQSRNLLGADGVIGPATYKALNISIDTAINQVRANMEKWRFFPRTLPSRFIFVDMGRQELDVMENNQLVDRMRVVVGRDIHGTPTMADKITSVIVNPYWHPPLSIIINETIPAMLRDPGYMSRMRMRVLDSKGQEIDLSTVDWTQYSMENPPPYKFRQDSGRYAALGLLKFNLTNSHAIYLHDTDNRSVFNKAVRYLSHGCIRVQRPVDLALYLLRDQGVTKEQLEQQFNDPTIQANKVRLTAAVPTLILGTTLTNYPDGSVVLGPDIYGQDARIINAMDGKASTLPLVAPPSEVPGTFSRSGAPTNVTSI